MIPGLFIGGSGRCGTTLLQNVVGCHTHIAAIPMETRFIIDPGGLIQMADALTVNYSPFLAREALHRLQQLLTHSLCTPHQRPYLRYNFNAIYGKEFYRQTVEEFFRQIVSHRFTGSSYFEFNPEARGEEDFRRPITGARYFKDRSQLIPIMASFVNTLFTRAAQMKHKTLWSEKTPYNVQHIDFLWELFPDAVILHIKRDPRAVVCSIVKPREYWAPGNIHDAALFLKSFYERWLHLKETVDFTHKRFMEIKFEDLVSHPHDTLSQIAALCQLEDRFQDLPQMKTHRLDYWKEELNVEDIDEIHRIMGPVIVKMGY
ncbi:MAG: sulfotransferase [bacterium]|nr:sulfotransferase [bacterium]